MPHLQQDIITQHPLGKMSIITGLHFEVHEPRRLVSDAENLVGFRTDGGQVGVNDVDGRSVGKPASRKKSAGWVSRMCFSVASKRWAKGGSSEGHSPRPHFPGSLAARPDVVEDLVLAVGIHGVEEAVCR